MKLVQLNIWQGRILPHVIRFLTAQQPDLLCLQEVYSAEAPVKDWDTFTALETIQAALPGYHSFFSPLFSFTIMGVRVTHGNAILSRFPLKNTETIFVHGHEVKAIEAEGYSENTRNLQRVTVELPQGKTLELINHHGYWAAGNPLGNPEATQKMKQVWEIAERSKHPLILAGDLNITPESPAMRVFDGKLTDLTAAYKLPTTLSRVAKAFDHHNVVPCDHILVSPDIRIDDLQVPDVIVSDHLPLVLTFTV